MHQLTGPGNEEPLSMLTGIRVLDLTSSIAAPYATMLLADFGAEVIKVERPGTGDDSRSWGPPFLDGESLWYLSVNRGKKSVTLDYAAEAGRRVLHKLVEGCDIVVLNVVDRVQRKLGIDYETLRALRPDLIFVSVTGFGLTGARANDPAYDVIAEGYSGIMDLTGEPDGPPQKVGAPAADLLAGMDAAMATLAAVINRMKTGRGQLIDISMVESMTRFLSPKIVSYLGSGEVSHRSGGRDSVIAVYQAFETADLPITLGLGNNGIWERFWVAVGDVAFGARAEFTTNADRRECRSDIVDHIATILRARSRAHWLEILRDARVPCGPINSIDEVADDETLRERGLFYLIEDNGRKVPQVGLGIQFDGRAPVPSAAPPLLGQHTDQILTSLGGIGADDIALLRQKGAI